jgi:hypothetical protein
MNPQARAILRWVPASRGGRKAPPSQIAGYSTVARFESDPGWSKGAWSLRIVDSSELRGSEAVEVRIMFVVPDAPHALLREGERFELLEGHKVVAKGVVLPPSVQVPQQISDFELALLG